MINMVEPRGAADGENVASGDALQDGELTSLIRRWMAAGTKVQDRVRRDHVLRLAPEPSSSDPDVPEPESAEPDSAGPEDTESDTSEVAEVTEVAGVEEIAAEDDIAATAYVVGTTPTSGSEPEPEDVRHEPQAATGFPPLPRRSTGAETEQVHRVALLIDARRVSADVATGLLQQLGERGSVNVCRAYADWNSADLGDWVGQMRREGLHSFHHFSDDDDQALVAMTIDAVDIARDAAVDEVVIAGDLTSALPLVHRLHAAGVRVVAVGSGHTPHDVRAACHEFIDTGSFDGTQAAPAGRHRA